MRSTVPPIYGTQIGFRTPAIVDDIKTAMRAGQFDFQAGNNRIAGIRVLGNVYYVREGHHRMAAALELHREENDPQWVLELIRWGMWAD